jgi:hypothetical protein
LAFAFAFGFWLLAFGFWLLGLLSRIRFGTFGSNQKSRFKKPSP